VQHALVDVAQHLRVVSGDAVLLAGSARRSNSSRPLLLPSAIIAQRSSR